eukprot:g5250.t1
MTSSVKNYDVVKIECSEEVHNEFRQLYELIQSVEEEDYTESSLNLARRCIVSNPSSYTAWKIYFSILEHLGWRTDEEVEMIIEDNPKNYQHWNFRRLAYNKDMVSASDELDNTDRALRQDNKNYHAWANRQAVLFNETKKGNENVWRSEMVYVHALLKHDVFNNSAWTQRAAGLKFMEVNALEKEVDFTFEVLKEAPHSTAAWNYLEFLVLDNDHKHIKRLKDVIQFCHEILKDHAACVPCLEILGEIYCALSASTDPNRNPVFKKSCMESAAKIWTNCAKINPIRSSYYMLKISHMCTPIAES